MNQNGTATASAFDGALFNRNINEFTAEMLAPYRGCYVAWSRDGTEIIGHHADSGELYRLLDERGLPMDGYVVAYLEPEDVVLI